MRVTLYMAVTPNGMIARENDDTEFVSDIEWENFSKKIKEIGTMVIGRKTYDIMDEDNAFEDLQDVKIIIMTKQKPPLSRNPNLIFTNQQPKYIIEYLEEKGTENILVAGGCQINSLFLKENLVDEIILDVEPILLGKGIKLCEDDFEIKLELLGTKKLSENEIQLHYKVLKYSS